MKTYDCGHTGPDKVDEEAIVSAGGWCVPSEVLYDLTEEMPSSCPDCSARMMMLMTIGIDPGPHGEYLKAKRGGIQYPRRER